MAPGLDNVNFQSLVPLRAVKMDDVMPCGFGRPLSQEDVSDVVSDCDDAPTLDLDQWNHMLSMLLDQWLPMQLDDGGKRMCSSEAFPVKAAFIHFDAPASLNEVSTPDMIQRSPSLATTSSPTGICAWGLQDAPLLDLDPTVDTRGDVGRQGDGYQSGDESSSVPSDYGGISRCSSVALPVKSTFIHFDCAACLGEEVSQQALKRSASAPSIVIEASVCALTTTLTIMKDAHDRGECKPCAYFLLKTDGCRWGAECEFCHICPTGELKKRKKEKAKSLKLEAQQLRATKNPVWYGRRPSWKNRKNVSK